MEEVFIRQIREALMLVVIVSIPPLGVALFVGLIINLLQSVTQIQEQTLSYVPKIIAVFLVLLGCLPWMMLQLVHFFQRIIEMIPALE